MYFRCTRLEATIRTAQCRENRLRRAAAVAPSSVPEWEIRPAACHDCDLAERVDAGSVDLFTAEQVLAGEARNGRGRP